MNQNPLGLCGIEFVEFASAKPDTLHRFFTEFGFARTHRNESGLLDLYSQNDIHFILNQKPHSYAKKFSETHGPCISSMGWRFQDAKGAYELALKRGAKAAPEVDLFNESKQPVPAILGIGGSLIYFIDQGQGMSLYSKLGFKTQPQTAPVKNLGFTAIDHLTNNVANGTMEIWADFYKTVFGFTEVRYFDIKGVKTGLQSYALRSPCGSFCIPINEAKDEKSQINEYLREYRGPGIQHLAFLTEDILKSLDGMKGTSIETLDIDDEYYLDVFNRVKNVTEDHLKIKSHKVLVDGDDDGYLLQIFTKNLVGPIFIEIIQRKNHLSFGEGNFGALFRSIERDQEKRGVFNA